MNTSDLLEQLLRGQGSAGQQSGAAAGGGLGGLGGLLGACSVARILQAHVVALLLAGLADLAVWVACSAGYSAAAVGWAAHWVAARKVVPAALIMRRWHHWG